MQQEVILLMVTAFSIGFMHTLLGPDHYLPFIFMSKSGAWTLKKTVWVTTLCGIGHVLSSVLLGFVGVSIGAALENLNIIEETRGSVAAWGLIIFGLIYLIYGLKKLNQKSNHHKESTEKKITPWILFLIFAFGPCEPLIPILIYPAAKFGMIETVIVASVFSVTTILTMLAVVVISIYSVKTLNLKPIERYTHVLAGATILLCGISIQFLGL